MRILSAEWREAARSLRRSPAVTLSAVLCLALGLGAATAIFSAINHVLLTPPPFRDPGRLVTVWRTTPHFNTGPFSAPNYLDLARESRQIGSLAAMTPTGGLLSGPDGAMQITVMRATGNLFSTLGVAAERGRFFGPDEDALDQPKVVVLSDQLWRGQFGADPGLIGKTVRLDGEAVTVTGITPPGFKVPQGSRVTQADAWVPMRFSENERSQRRNNYLMVFGRLAPGASVTQANADLVNLFNHITETYPALQGEGVRVLSLTAEAVRSVRGPLLLLMGAVVMVLLIAATNVASLLLARGVQRRRETAIRVALGGGRWAVMRPILLESVLLAMLGVAGGLGLAWLGLRTIGVVAGARLPQLLGVGMDARVVLFAGIVALLTALGCGLAPAWKGTTVSPQDALRDGRGGGSGRSHHRALSSLVIAEVALSLVLLIGAGLVMKGFSRLLSNDPGFDPSHILTLQTTVSPTNYPDGSSVSRFLEPALAAIRQVPGVEAAGSISLLPYVNWGWNFNIRYEGQPGDNPTQMPLVERRVVNPEFFDVTQQRLISGRLLRPGDDERAESPAVVVVNQALARRDFAGADPVGKRFYTDDTSFATIVGVVSDIRNAGPFREPSAEVYWSWHQGGLGSTTFPMMIRVAGRDPAIVAAAVRDAIRGVDPGAAVTAVRTMPEVIGESVGQPRFYLTLLATFSAIALLLALAGLYGVMNYAVTQRTRELGIRLALGSSPLRTVGLVAAQGSRLVGGGLVIGMIGGVIATRVLTSMLYGVSPLDPGIWAAALVLFALSGVAATLIPALRATRVDPLKAIRVE